MFCFELQQERRASDMWPIHSTGPAGAVGVPSIRGLNASTIGTVPVLAHFFLGGPLIVP